MIYLIDDNRFEQQQKVYHADYLFNDTFKSILTTIYKVKIDEHKKLANDIRNSSVILIHNTFADADENGVYLDSSRRIRDFIVADIAEEEDIPYVLFSGGMSETTFDDEDNPNIITSINKNLFYENLYPFLLHFKETSEIELKILAYGNEYKIYDAIKLLETIIAKLQQKNEQIVFQLTMIDLKEFHRFYALSKSKKSVAVFLDELINNPLTVGEFIQKLKKIKKSLFTYGENIYD